MFNFVIDSLTLILIYTVFIKDLIKEVSTDEKFEPINIHSSIKCIEEWQKVQKYKLYSDK